MGKDDLHIIRDHDKGETIVGRELETNVPDTTLVKVTQPERDDEIAFVALWKPPPSGMPKDR